MADDRPFAVSAPGKVIVVGEHAVVHGKSAIAAAISLRSYLLVTPSPSSSSPSPTTNDHPTVTLDFPDIALRHTWPTAALPWSAFAALGTVPRDRVTRLDEGCVEALRGFVDEVGSSSESSSPSEGRNEEVVEAKRKREGVHKAAASAFLYLFCSLCPPPRPAPSASFSATTTGLKGSTTFTLRSTIPIGAGLGSSASISVCLATALLQLTSSLPLTCWPRLPPTQRNETAETINNWAFVGELCIHGTPSGIDNTVSTRGKAVKFRKMVPPQGPEVELLESWPTLPLLLMDTKRSRSTAVEVAKVRTLKEAYPAVIEHVLSAIEEVTEGVHALTSTTGSDAEMDLEKLGGLIRLNHGLLATLGVSHPDLETVRTIVDGPAVGWTKLTGAGGGGCAFSILNPKASEKDLRVVVAGLEAAGCERYETVLGGHGVGMLAEFRGGDLETFRSLEGGREIEQFMDVNKVAGEGVDGWWFLD